MEKLTYDRAVELAREVVSEFGEDYVYPEDHKQWHTGTKMCVYVYEDRPSCLVGQILHRHGVSLDTLRENEFRGAYVVTRVTCYATDEALDFVHELQSAQDGGLTWGESLDKALRN